MTCLEPVEWAVDAMRERAEAAEREYGVAMTVLDEVRADRDSLAAQLAEAKRVIEAVEAVPRNHQFQNGVFIESYMMARDIEAALKGSK